MSTVLREPHRSHDLALETLQAHAGSLLRLARRYSLCADDAHDAYQRAVEIFLRRLDSAVPEQPDAWLRTVVKNEALAVRRSRLQVVSHEEPELERHESQAAPSLEDRVESFDRLTRSAEALQRLKPQELRALLLKAQGHSYAEIGELTGWTRTKVNRCITEGRRAFLDRYAGIESGAECERWAPLLSVMADGEATAEQLAQVRPHLRNCPGCRARLREFHRAPRDVAALVPATPLVPVAGAGLLDMVRAAWTGARETIASLLARAPIGGEAAGAAALGGGGTLAAGGAKVAALCVSVSVAAGGAYCLDRTGALGKDGDRGAEHAAPAPAQSGSRKVRERISAPATAAATATRTPATAGGRRDEPTRARDAAGRRFRRVPDGVVLNASPAASAPSESPATSGSGDTDSFSFEDADGAGAGTGATRPSEPATAAPSPSTPTTPPPSDEFSGGGFED